MAAPPPRKSPIIRFERFLPKLIRRTPNSKTTMRRRGSVHPDAARLLATPNTFAPSECAKVSRSTCRSKRTAALRPLRDAPWAPVPFSHCFVVRQKKSKLRSDSTELGVSFQITENNTGAFPESPSYPRCHGTDWIMPWLTAGLYPAGWRFPPSVSATQVEWPGNGQLGLRSRIRFSDHGTHDRTGFLWRRRKGPAMLPLLSGDGESVLSASF